MAIQTYRFRRQTPFDGLSDLLPSAVTVTGRAGGVVFDLDFDDADLDDLEQALEQWGLILIATNPVGDIEDDVEVPTGSTGALQYVEAQLDSATSISTSLTVIPFQAITDADTGIFTTDNVTGELTTVAAGSYRFEADVIAENLSGTRQNLFAQIEIDVGGIGSWASITPDQQPTYLRNQPNNDKEAAILSRIYTVAVGDKIRVRAQITTGTVNVIGGFLRAVQNEGAKGDKGDTGDPGPAGGGMATISVDGTNIGLAGDANELDLLTGAGVTLTPTEPIVGVKTVEVATAHTVSVEGVAIGAADAVQVDFEAGNAISLAGSDEGSGVKKVTITSTAVTTLGTYNEEHEALRSLAHWIQCGPYVGFGNEVFYAREGPAYAPTRETWYRDAGLTKPLFDRSTLGAPLARRVHYRSFDEDGNVLAAALELCDGPTPRRLMTLGTPTQQLLSSAPLSGSHYWLNPTGGTLYQGIQKATFIWFGIIHEWKYFRAAGIWKQFGVGNTSGGTRWVGQDSSNRGRWTPVSNVNILYNQVDTGQPTLLVSEFDFTEVAAADRTRLWAANGTTQGALVEISLDGIGSGSTDITGWNEDLGVPGNDYPMTVIGEGLNMSLGHLLWFPNRLLTDDERTECKMTSVGPVNYVANDPLTWSFIKEADFWIPGQSRRNGRDGSFTDVIRLREFNRVVAA